MFRNKCLVFGIVNFRVICTSIWRLLFWNLWRDIGPWKKKGLPCVIDLRRVIVLLRFFRAFSCFFLCKFVHRRVWLVFCMHLRLAGFKFLSRTRQFWRIVYHFGFRNIFIYVIFSRYNICSRYMLNDFIFNRLQKWRRF